MQSSPRSLKSSSWLAQRLGVSITTIERLRAVAPSKLPPAISIGKSIRYDEAQVETWLLGHQKNAPDKNSTQQSQGENHVAS